MDRPINNSSSINITYHKASFFRRLAAQIIDLLIYYLAYNVIYFTIYFTLNLLFLFLPQKQYIDLYKTNPQLYITSWLVFMITIIVIFFFIPIFIYLRYIQKTGYSLGKRLLKLKIISVNNSSLNFSQVFLREIIIKPISLLYFGLGFFWLIWDKNQQTWHDKITKTYVVTSVSSSNNHKWNYVFMISLLTILLGINFSYIYLLFKEIGNRDTERVKEADYKYLLKIQDTLYSIEKKNINGTLLCNGVNGHCEGKSSKHEISSYNIDGSGWIKVNFKQLGFRNISLPGNNYKTYKYCSDGKNWEISITYEDYNNQDYEITYLAKSDGGNNPDAFELGSNKLLCN